MGFRHVVLNHPIGRIQNTEEKAGACLTSTPEDCQGQAHTGITKEGKVGVKSEKWMQSPTQQLPDETT